MSITQTVTLPNSIWVRGNGQFWHWHIKLGTSVCPKHHFRQVSGFHRVQRLKQPANKFILVIQSQQTKLSDCNNNTIRSMASASFRSRREAAEDTWSTWHGPASRVKSMVLGDDPKSIFAPQTVAFGRKAREILQPGLAQSVDGRIEFIVLMSAT